MATLTAVRPIIRNTPTPPPPDVSTSKSAVFLSHLDLGGLKKDGMPASVQLPPKQLAPADSASQSSAPIATPPPSPQPKPSVACMSSLLYPADAYPLMHADDPSSLRVLTPSQAAAAIHYTANQQLPPPEQVFPWLHGLHPQNHIQLAFFFARKKSQRRPPTALRLITIIKAGGDLNNSRLKGAILPEEVINPQQHVDSFHQADPVDGFSVRNFHIQTAKAAQLSDIIVYGDHHETVVRIAAKCLAAQAAHRRHQEAQAGSRNFPRYHTFIVEGGFSEFEKYHPELVAVDSKGNITDVNHDFFYWERQEMCAMSKSSEISRNVWLGPSADAGLDPSQAPQSDESWEVLIEACDAANIPTAATLTQINSQLNTDHEVHLEFPSSGNLTGAMWSQYDVDGLIDMCRWMYSHAHIDTPAQIDVDEDGDSMMDAEDNPQGRRMLLHCADGYTETSLLALAYLMFAEGLEACKAWTKLHVEKKRNFFAYQSDINFLRQVEQRILEVSPARIREATPLPAVRVDPVWFLKMDGSFPSRILPYLYLGNLGHANNPEMLKRLGINQVLSIGEMTTWSAEERSSWPIADVLKIENVQDNGVDSLTPFIQQCLDFITDGRKSNGATLVHCRVGVSRSATICIAEVMQALNLCLARAYCFVRARRLNVIIQPHVRFMYELLKWEEQQAANTSKEAPRRNHEWASIAREVAHMNRPYSR